MPTQSRVLTGQGPSSAVTAMPAPSAAGQVLISDGEVWRAAQPIVGAEDGWLSNDDAELLIEGYG